MGYIMKEAVEEDYRQISEITIHNEGSISKFIHDSNPEFYSDKEKLIKALEEHFMWKFKKNPLWVVKKGGEIVGMGGVLSVELKFKTGYYSASWDANLFVKKEHRNKSIGSWIIKKRRNYADFSMNYPSSKMALRIYKKLGDKMFSVPVYIKPILSSKKKKMKLDIKEIKRFDEEINSFWARVENNFEFIVKRDMDYLNWKYVDIKPKMNYKIFLARNNGIIGGYIILRTINASIKQGLICDLLTNPNDKVAISSLINFAANYFKEKNIKIVIFSTLYKKYKNALFKKGFFWSFKSLRGSIARKQFDIPKKLDIFINGTDSDGA
ncbi:GNAT family N-acetyltransferase [Candidatus Woesearchaeota archaeon]|nr:GNAT family N-acetyltransferase [Candidatus Woesearchaeota archaeon]